MPDYVSLVEDKPGLSLNQSRIKCFQNCKRRYYFTFVENIVADRPRWALHIGTAVHAGLAKWSSSKDIATALSEAQTALQDSLPKRRMPGDEEELAKAVSQVDNLLRAYFEFWGNDDELTPLGIEIAGRVEVGENSGFFLTFRLDKLVTWKKQLWIMDHKTAARMDPRDLLKYEMDLQPTAYVYGTMCVLQKPVAGLLIDVLVKTKVPQFHREPFIRDLAALQAFELEFCEIAGDIATRRSRVEAGEDPHVVFYKNTDDCFRYGTCQYVDLCKSDTPERRAAFTARETDYVDDTSKLVEKPEAGDAE